MMFSKRKEIKKLERLTEALNKLNLEKKKLEANISKLLQGNWKKTDEKILSKLQEDLKQTNEKIKSKEDEIEAQKKKI